MTQFKLHSLSKQLGTYKTSLILPRRIWSPSHQNTKKGLKRLASDLNTCS